MQVVHWVDIFTPIARTDPFGDDDYYDKKGRYLGTTDTKSTDIRLIDRKTWNDIKAQAKKEKFGKDAAKISEQLWDLTYKPAQEKLTAKSVVVKVQSTEDQQKVLKELETKTAETGKETAGIIVLDVEKNTLFIKVDSKAKGTATHVDRSPTFTYDDDPDTRYVLSNKKTQIVIGGIHTHPQTEGDESHGPSTPENALDQNYVDTKTSQKTKSNEYVIDKELYKATPSGGTEQVPSGTDVARDAIKTYGKERK